MDEIYRSLGRDRERELLREAERLHRGTRARRGRSRSELPPAFARAAEILRRAAGGSVRLARGQR